jgi:putative transposon-encoded protein
MGRKGIKIELEAREILERQATRFGTGAHVIVPKEYKGRTVKIILVEDEKGGKTHEN